MKILLLCSVGMSTSLIVSKMKKSLQEDEQDWVIEAWPVDSFDDIGPSYDVVLLGPQMSYKKDELTEKANGFGIPLQIIDPFLYGIADGEKILEMAKEMKEESMK
ncbi:PTS sugar transporter subunit IIB [Erysipelothrix urinaevulpis]|uniref:PTS sugar transporter subunit IIB n=1 Tax=Erysipelothrix urinaevulpis TaxID=2683717 RepID=UPI001915DA00|nr:PTS sugar transporter subunit IIB [Erysipelothrix urinaevulpis]